jgi:dCMP deaminase
MMKPKFIDYFMKVAELTAAVSSAKRLQVGAIIVKDDRIISIGYNGMPAGWDNTCEYALEDGTLKTKPEVLHAEMNVLMKVAQSTESSTGAVMFCTHAPCMDCAKAIYQAGISTLYYREEYRSTQGMEFLKKSGVNVLKYESRDK